MSNIENQEANMKDISDHAVTNIMRKDVITVTHDKTMMDVAKLMAAKSISCILVVKNNKPIGIITERDLTKTVVKYTDLSSLKVTDVMSKPVMSIPPDTNLVHAARLMREKNIRRFPVVKNGKLVGVITETDIMRAMISLIRYLNWRLVNTEIDVEQYFVELRRHKLVDPEDLFRKQKK